MLSDVQCVISAIFAKNGVATAYAELPEGKTTVNNISESACKVIFELLSNRKISLKLVEEKIEPAIDKLAKEAIYLQKQNGYIHIDNIAQVIVAFCKKHNILIDDQLMSIYERDEAIDESELFKLLSDANLLLSQQHANYVDHTVANDNDMAVKIDDSEDAAQAVQNTAPVNVSQPAAVNNQSGSNSGAKIPYKSLGPLSGNLVNLIGKPYQKQDLQTTLYCVMADKIGANTPRAFITPIDNAGNPTKDPGKIKFGSGNGYSDCILWFDNLTDAANCSKYCQSNFGKYANIKIGKDSKPSGGYFLVNTAIGAAYIKAIKLNEDLLMDKEKDIEKVELNEEDKPQIKIPNYENKKVKTTNSYSIALEDFDRFEEVFHSSYN